ncbi:hypothetical protein VNO77_20218 [Canavalia gladiata]|uniref:Uncharacterized protein n=1 Tax=Canavalia gladiata TaxID=3824 RepID=A0AAN9QL40_CANGL
MKVPLHEKLMNKRFIGLLLLSDLIPENKELLDRLDPCITMTICHLTPGSAFGQRVMLSISELLPQFSLPLLEPFSSTVYA